MQASSKRRKGDGRPETPLSLFKQAVRLVRQQPCGDVTADAEIEQKLCKAVQLLEADHKVDSNHQPVTHSLDLELPDEPLFVFASAHLQLGLLYQRQDRLDAAQQEFRSALQHFPRFVAALTALGQVLKAAAASPESLLDADQLLQQAIDIAGQLSKEEGGLLIESNKACAAEVEAADAARAALAMLLCQRGQDVDAASHLKALGYKFRLSQEVLQYAIPKHRTVQGASTATAGQQVQEQEPQASTSTCSFMQAADQALPAELLQHLQHVFRPGAPFWRQHAYGRVGYFSYFFPLGQTDSSSMHQLAHYLQRLGMQYFPDLADAKYAEFWAHCRRHTAGHQLHFDSDDEGQGGVRHPIITAIVYLSDNTSPTQHPQQFAQDGVNGAVDGCSSCSAAQASSPCSCSRQDWVGGPTLMTDQVLGGPLATQGWLAYPATNRVVFFDGRYLHGVVPGRSSTPSSDGRRSTLMVAFWRDLKCRTQPGSGPGACMPMPDPASQPDGDTWHHELQPLSGEWTEAIANPVHELQHVSAVWQPVDAGTSTSGAAYQYCFQGF